VDDPYLLTLHALTLRQPATAEQINGITGLPAAEIETALDKAVGQKEALAARGAYLITPAGRQRLDGAYPVVYAALRADPRATAAMDRFEAGVNKQVLTLITEWQTVEVDGRRMPNDHSDPDYDAAIIDRLGTAHERAADVLAPITAADGVADRFIERLGAALVRAEGGEIEYVSGARVDSFHTVWFQMHEHLLRMFGRERPE